MIRSYTKEAGVRGLERKIGEICRKTAREIYQNKKDKIRVNTRKRKTPAKSGELKAKDEKL